MSVILHAEQSVKTLPSREDCITQNKNAESDWLIKGRALSNTEPATMVTEEAYRWVQRSCCPQNNWTISLENTDLPSKHFPSDVYGL